MDNEEPAEEPKLIPDLEMVHWTDEENSDRGQALKYGLRVEHYYETYSELYDALLEHGPLVVASSKVDVCFVAVSGEFDGHVMAIRQSGRNVRRFLVWRDTFEETYGNFQNCVDHIRSNNAIGIELELKHLRNLGEKLSLMPKDLDPLRNYDRFEVDVVAALQHRGRDDRR